MIKTDKKKIKQVITNLLDNSVRALIQSDGVLGGTKYVAIKTSVMRDSDEVEILVTDNGPGIKESVKDKLFFPYVSSERKNMGLGLAIVHDTISQLGGKIRLLPSGKGATFQILLPL